MMVSQVLSVECCACGRYSHFHGLRSGLRSSRNQSPQGYPALSGSLPEPVQLLRLRHQASRPKPTAHGRVLLIRITDADPCHHFTLWSRTCFASEPVGFHSDTSQVPQIGYAFMLAYAPNKWMQNDEADSGSHTLLQLHSHRWLLAAGCTLRIEAAVATRKQRTQKRHKAIRNKVCDPTRPSHSLGICKATDTDHIQCATQVNGSSDQPRLAVYRSNNHIYAQVWFFEVLWPGRPISTVAYVTECESSFAMTFCR